MILDPAAVAKIFIQSEPLTIQALDKDKEDVDVLPESIMEEGDIL